MWTLVVLLIIILFLIPVNGVWGLVLGFLIGLLICGD